MVPTEQSKVDNFANGPPLDISPTVKLETILKVVIWVAKNVETQIRDKNLEKVEGGKRMSEWYSRTNKKNGFSKFGSGNKKSGGNNEVKWWEKCKVKHVRKCIEDVAYYTYGNVGHYDSKCTPNQKHVSNLEKQGISRRTA